MQVLRIDRPPVDQTQPALGVDQEVFRHTGATKFVGALSIAVAQLGIGETVLVHEPLSVVTEVAGVDAEHGEAGTCVSALEALKRRRLLAAGDAPGRPEVDQNPAAPVIGERPAPGA